MANKLDELAASYGEAQAPDAIPGQASALQELQASYQSPPPSTDEKQVQQSVYTPTVDDGTNKNAENVMQYMADLYQLGDAEVAKNYAMFGAMHERESYEDVQQRFNSDQLNIQRKSRISVFQNVHNDVLSQVGEFLGDVLIESAPSFIQPSIAGAVGAAEGAAVGAPGGVPGVIAGGLLGFTSGTATATGIMQAGATYAHLRERGLTHDDAKAWGVGGGIIAAGLAALRTDKLGEWAKSGFEGVANSKSLGPGAVQAFARLTHAVGWGSVLGAYQAGLDQELQMTAAVIHNGRAPSLTEAGESIGMAAVQGGLTAGAVHGTSAGVGYVYGHVMPRIIKQIVGEPIESTVGVDVAAAQAVEAKNVAEARDAEGRFQQIESIVEQKKANGENVSPALLYAYTDAKEHVAVTAQKAKNAEQSRIALEAFATLPPEERLQEAEKQRVLAENRLSNIQFQIDQLDEIPKELREERRQRRIDLRIATEQKREAELAIERDALNERAKSKETGEGAKLAAQSAINKIDRELHTLKVSETRRMVDTKRRQIQADLDNMQQELKENVSEKNPMVRLQNKIIKLEGQLEALNMLDQLIEDDHLDDKELSSVITKLPTVRVDALTNMTRQLVGRVANESAKSGISDTLRETGLVNKLTRLFGLTQTEQAGLRKFKPGIETRKGGVKVNRLAEYLDYLDEQKTKIVDKRDLEQAKEKLDRSVERTKPKEINKTLRGLPKVQAVLDFYRQVIDGEVDAQKVLDEPITQSDVDEDGGTYDINILSRKAIAAEVLEATTPEKLRDLAEHIDRIAEHGVTEKIARLEAYQERLKTGVESLLKLKPEKSDKEKSFDIKVKMDAFTDERGIRQAPFVSVMRLLFGKDAKWISTRKAVDFERRLSIELREQLYDFIIGDDKKNEQQIVDNAKAQHRSDAPYKEFRDVSDAVLMQWLNRLDDSSLESQIENGNEFDRSKLRAWIDKQLTPRQKVMAAQYKVFYAHAYDIANEAHIEKFGYPLENNPHYSGPARTIQEDTNTNDFLSAIQRRGATTPGFLKTRRENNSPLEVNVDANQQAVNYSNALARFVAMNKEFDGQPGLGDRLTSAFSGATKESRDLRLNTTNQHGQAVMDMIDVAYKDITGIEPSKNKVDPLLRAVMHSAGSTIHSAYQLVKQTVGGLPVYGVYESPAALWNGANEVLHNFEQYSKIFMDSDFIKSREGSSAKVKMITAKLDNIKAKLGDNPFLNTIHALQQFQGKFLEAADMANIMLGGGALYIADLQRRHGANWREFIGKDEAALDYMARASEDTQGSTAIDQKSQLERDRPLLTQFTKPAVQAHFAASLAVREAIQDPFNPTKVKDAIMASVAVRIAEIAFVGASAVPSLVSAFALRDKEKIEKALRDLVIAEALAFTIGPATGLPALGRVVFTLALKDTINMTLSAIYGTTRGEAYETTVPVIEIFNSFSRLVWEAGKVASGQSELTREETYRIARATNRSLVMGLTQLNVQPVLDASQFLFDFAEGADAYEERVKDERAEHRQKVKEREEKNSLGESLGVIDE